MRKPVYRLLCNSKLGVDDNGFLYRFYAGDVAKPIAPKIHPKADRASVHFYVTINGRQIRFEQSVLKELGVKAIGKVMK